MLAHVRSLILTALFMFASAAWAGEKIEGDLIVTPIRDASDYSQILDANDPQLDNEELSIVYDPKDFPGATVAGSKEELLESLRLEMETPQKTELSIPRAPISHDQLEKLSTLTESEIQAFLGKKQKFLEKMAKALTFIRLKPKLVNKVLNELNNKFYNSSRMIANSNTVGGAFMISVSGGLVLPRKLVAKLQERTLGRFIPKSGGFAYLLGIGVGVSRTIKSDGKPHWIVDIFMDVEKIKSSMTGVASVGAAGTYGVVYEFREGDFKKQQIDTSYGGLSGVFKQGDNHFGWAASTGLSFPPGVGSIMIFTNQTTRHYLARVDLTVWMERVGFKSSPTLLCSKALL